MATITKYPGGRWRAVVRKVGFSTQSDIFPTRQRAEAWAKKLETEMDNHTFRDQAKFKTDDVGSIFERFRDEVCQPSLDAIQAGKKPTEAGLAHFRKGARWDIVRINSLLENAEFMKRRISVLQPADIRAWRDERVKQVKAISVKRELGLISGVFRHAINEWSYPFPFNPCHEVSRPQITGKIKRERRWSQDEIDALCKACDYDPATPPKAQLDYVPWGLLLMIETAMRPSEFCNARVADVHLAQRYVHVIDSKNGDDRKVPLSSRAITILATLTRDKKPTDPVFPITSQTLGVYYRKARKAAGLADSNLRFYDAKHEGISRMAGKFRDAVELSKVTGHRDLKSLSTYYNPHVEELADKLG